MNPFSTTVGARVGTKVPEVKVPAPPVVEKVNTSALSDMRDLNGIFFDAATGKTYKEDGTFTGFTFEKPTWTGPFGLAIAWPWLNPISFATVETAEKIRATVQKWLISQPRNYHGWETIVEEQKVTGPFTRTPERVIRIRRFNTDASPDAYSAGEIANLIMRNSEEAARISVFTELRNSGANVIL